MTVPARWCGRWRRSHGPRRLSTSAQHLGCGTGPGDRGGALGPGRDLSPGKPAASTLSRLPAPLRTAKRACVSSLSPDLSTGRHLGRGPRDPGGPSRHPPRRPDYRWVPNAVLLGWSQQGAHGLLPRRPWTCSQAPMDSPAPAAPRCGDGMQVCQASQQPFACKLLPPQIATLRGTLSPSPVVISLLPGAAMPSIRATHLPSVSAGRPDCHQHRNATAGLTPPGGSAPWEQCYGRCMILLMLITSFRSLAR